MLNFHPLPATTRKTDGPIVISVSTCSTIPTLTIDFTKPLPSDICQTQMQQGVPPFPCACLNTAHASATLSPGATHPLPQLN